MELNKIYHQSVIELIRSLPDQSVDVCFTDPPYPGEYFESTFKVLARELPRVLRRGASLLLVHGHYQLEKVMLTFNGQLKYRWLLCFYQETGNHARMAMGVEVMFKPCLWYVKEAYPVKRGFVRDAWNITGTSGIDKPLHKWQQDIQPYLYYLRHVARPGMVVLDPFCGSGTTLAAARYLGLDYLGGDIEKASVLASRETVRRIKPLANPFELTGTELVSQITGATYVPKNHSSPSAPETQAGTGRQTRSPNPGGRRRLSSGG